ncbi:hypothetical protein FRC17_011317 [Serendipita sp. 399]|nr:hypothetical protein FRC17_011317 [Serendipita sp. 399]
MQFSATIASLFDGDISGSESDTSITPSPLVSSPKGRSKQVQKPKPRIEPIVPRPKRDHKNILSYAESDTDEDQNLSPTSPAVSGTKRKRSSQAEDSPRKKAAVNRGRSNSVGTAQLNGSPRKGSKAFATTLPTIQLIPTSPKKHKGSPTKRSRAFIRLNANGESPSEGIVGAYWWPAKLSESTPDESLIYQLFGDDGKGKARQVTVDSNSDSHIQSIWNPAPIPRYTYSTFQDGDVVDKARFREALDQLILDEVDDEGDEDEEEVSDNQEDDMVEQAMDWRPPSPTEFLECVGQPVLCKIRPESKEFWPAKVVAYIPPTKSSVKPRFQVNFFDWKTATVTRDCFYTQYDDDELGFADCKMDRKKLSSWTEKNSQVDEEDDDFDIDFSQLAAPRNPPPQPRFFINEMGIEEQFAYSTSVRPRGSARYEALDEREKGLFIVDVLLGEAVIQLLLLRAGKRMTLDLLSDEEENALHDVGLSLSREESTSVTVRTVLEARKRLRKRLGLRQEIHEGVPTEGEGRRPKNRVITI